MLLKSNGVLKQRQKVIFLSSFHLNNRYLCISKNTKREKSQHDKYVKFPIN
jgi:hypothetical protein